MTTLETDLLIVGAGAAGIITALNASARRICVLHAGGEHAVSTASEIAQGGIAAAVGSDDTVARHVTDTWVAGHGRSRGETVRYTCSNAPAAIHYLESLGVCFARRGQQWSLHLEAAHSRARVLHAGGDATGAVIMDTLRRRLREASWVDELSGMRALGLLHDAQGVHGVIAMSADGRRFRVRARDVVLATGGLGGLYSRTTNPRSACGDGVAMALAAGAHCEALDAVQFHPTALDVAERPLPLISEALRGAGARLIDATGRRIMPTVHPLGDLAPRDVVARAVYLEQRSGRRVWLDATELGSTDMAESFPTAYRQCRARGIDPCREPIPVTPAAHYHMGGITVDLDGRSGLPRLWAVGEVACTGLHGANRLASNSLLEAVVFGQRLGQVLARDRGTVVQTKRITAAAEESDAGPQDDSSNHSGGELRELMWQCLGPVREAATLVQGLGQISVWRTASARQPWVCRDRLGLAEAMLRAALLATETPAGSRPGSRSPLSAA
ncbi:MAG: FAD-binding protein [Steroidobacteraceae bacterium]|nr:FAD-binding protein [Nevskiaceae bacterium]MCP5359733.1 FAD-binding protein [Nevskiaceae bacterium]MCP5472777.1 FAD-binding protein [Nevskiaceae bacterium]